MLVDLACGAMGRGSVGGAFRGKHGNIRGGGGGGGNFRGRGGFNRGRGRGGGLRQNGSNTNGKQDGTTNILPTDDGGTAREWYLI